MKLKKNQHCALVLSLVDFGLVDSLILEAEVSVAKCVYANLLEVTLSSSF